MTKTRAFKKVLQHVTRAEKVNTSWSLRGKEQRKAKARKQRSEKSWHQLGSSHPEFTPMTVPFGPKAQDWETKLRVAASVKQVSDQDWEMKQRVAGSVKQKVSDQEWEMKAPAVETVERKVSRAVWEVFKTGFEEASTYEEVIPQLEVNVDAIRRQTDQKLFDDIQDIVVRAYPRLPLARFVFVVKRFELLEAVRGALRDY